MSQENVEVVRQENVETAMVATLRNGKVTRMDNYEDRGEALEAAGLRE